MMVTGRQADVGHAGRVLAVIFDWAGTTVDDGCIAPVRALVESFRRFDVSVTEAQARTAMGLAKRDHIRAIGETPAVSRAWRNVHTAAFNEEDVGRIYETFVQLQPGFVVQCAEPIAGLLTTLKVLRQRRVRIGSTTGYPRAVMDVLLLAAARFGFTPQNVICEDDVARGRPAPYMALRSMMDLDVWPVSACVAVDDTAIGIEAGLNAGMWTVGVVMTGNYVGLTSAQRAAFDRNELSARRQEAYRTLNDAGAHLVIDSVADLLPVIDEIERRLSAGQRP